jgi:hypothetical protein
MSHDDRNDRSFEKLRLEYEEICRSHQGIADFRAKLLALLPLASGAGLFVLLEKQKDTRHVGAIGLFGFAVTLGLFLYELRGMDECLLLRERGTSIEIRMNISPNHARFLGNPAFFVGPQGAGWLIYTAVLTAWLYVARLGFGWSKVPLWVLPIFYFSVILIGSLFWRKAMDYWRERSMERDLKKVKKEAPRPAVEAPGPTPRRQSRTSSYS